MAIASTMLPLVLSAHVVVAPAFLEWSTARSSGPGGQNVNKVESKVRLRFDFERCDSLAADVKTRLRERYARRLDVEGRIVITSQVTRDQPRNLEDARERLTLILRDALVKPRVRKKTKPSRRAVERRLTSKRHVGERKRDRRSSGGD